MVATEVMPQTLDIEAEDGIASPSAWGRGRIIATIAVITTQRLWAARLDAVSSVVIR
jgi:hypothetical protein